MKLLIIFIIFIDGVLSLENYVIGTCGRKECEVGQKFGYESGHSYVYNYEANIVTSIQGSSEDFTGIFIETQAEIHAISQCEFVLKLRQVNLRSRDVDNPAPNEYAVGYDVFKSALEQRPLFFSFDDGAVDHVCADGKESQWVLNIKRAILSSLQNNAKDVITSTKKIERDILGDCPTEYILNYGWTSVKAKKTKELDKCVERLSFLSAIQSTPYTSPKGSPLSPILRSTYSCEQTIEHLIIQKVTCDERHLLRPFSNGENGAVTLTKQTLTLIDDVRRPFAFNKDDTRNLQRTTLLFNHDYQSPLKKDSNHQHNAEMALHHLCDQSRDDVRPETPQLFWQLISTLRHLNYSKTAEIFHNVDRICDFTSRGQKLFRDALAMVNTVASVTLMKELIIDQSVPPDEVSAWLGELAFYPNPTREVLVAIIPLLTVSEPSTKTLLSFASLAHSYCQRDTACNSTEEVHTLLGLIESRLGSNCNARHADETQRLVVALKALGNLGQWNKPFTTLERCSSDDSNPVAVRIAAIDAYRRLSCSVSRRHFLRNFLNIEEDVEIRIASYLAVMNCPTPSIVDDIRKALLYEDVHQVNAFVWSHLHSIRDSVDPGKRYLVSILEEIELKDKYIQDIRKYSRAIERSAFSERENGGGHLEAHLIYSPNSFLPRSAMLNITVDLFGQSVNLLELNGRISGVEFLAESFFRPVPNSVEVLLDSKQSDLPSPDNRAENRMNQFAKLFRSKSKKTYQTSNPEAALSMKVFGQEVWYGNAGSGEIEAAVAGLDRYGWTMLSQFSQDREFEMKRDSILIDSTFVTPTLSGLPLVLKLNATASVHLKMAGKMELPRGVRTNDNTNIQGYIKPSAALAVLATMEVDGYVGKSGVKLDANLHTSTALDGAIEKTNTGTFKLHLNMPKERIDFVQMSTNIVLHHWSKDRPLRVTTVNRNDYTGCTTEWTSKSLGVELCTEIRFSNATDKQLSPSFPLNGPSRIAFLLKKTDPLLSVYHFDYWKPRNDIPEDPRYPAAQRGFLLSFRTPHSRDDREWTAEYIINPAEQSLSVRFITPYKKIIAKGHYSDEANRKAVYANIDVDGYEALSVQSELRINQRENHTQYVPKVIVKVPSHTVLNLEGFCHFSPGRHLSVDVSIENLTNKPIIFRGEVTKNEGQEGVRYDAVFNSPMLDASTKGYLNKIEGGLTSKTKIDYQLNGLKKETIDLTMKMRYQSPPSRSLTTAGATFDIHMSEAPQYNLVVDWDYQLADGHVENTIRVERYDEQDRMLSTRLVFLQQILSYEGTIDHNKLSGKLKVVAPSRDTDFLVEIDHKNLLNSLHSYLRVHAGSDRDYILELLLRDDSVDLTDVSALVRVQSGDSVNRVSVNITEEQLHQYLALVSTVGQPFGELVANITYLNRGSQTDINQVMRIRSEGSLQFHGSWSVYVTEESGQLIAQGIYEESYQFNGDCQYIRIRPQEYELSFSIKRDLAVFKGVAEVNTGEVKAMTFDVTTYSGRRIAGDTSLRFFFDSKAYVLNVAWDVDRDRSQRFNFSVNYDRLPDQRTTAMVLSYLERAIQLEFGHRTQQMAPVVYAQGTHVLVEWAGARKLGVDLHFRVHSPRNRRDITGSLDLFTPLSGLDQVTVNVTHHDDGLSWRSDGAATINQKYPFHASSSGKTWRHSNQHYLDATTNINTPFEGLENILVTLSHDLAASQIKTTGKVQWSPGESVVVELHGIKPDASYERALAGVNITTPFDAFSNLNFSLHHSLFNRKLNSGVLFLWNGDRLIDVNANGKAVQNSTEYVVDGTVSINTPLEGFANVTASIDHVQSSTRFRTELTTLMPHQDQYAAVTVEGNNLRTDKRSLVGGSVDIISPLLTFGSGLEYQRTDSGFTGHLAGNWKNSSALLGINGEYKSMADFNFGTHLSTPISGMENTTLTLANHIQGSSIDSKLRGNLGDSEAGVNLEAKWDFSSKTAPRTLEASFRLDSPVTSFPDMFADLNHHKEVGDVAIYHSTARGGWGETVATVDHSISLRNSLNFEDSLIMGLPIKGLEHVLLTINQSMNGAGQLKNILELRVLDDVLVSTDLDLTMQPRSVNDKRRRINTLLKFYSSIWSPNKMQIAFDHEDDEVEYSPTIRWRTLDTKTDKYMNVSFYLNSLPGNKNFLVTVNSPIPRHEIMSLAGMYNVKGDELDFDLSTRWTDRDHVTVEGKVAIDVLSPRLRLTVQSPSDGYSLFRVDGSYDTWGHRKMASFFVQKEDWNISLIASGTFENDAMVAGLVVHTLDPAVGVINVNVTSGWGTSLRGFRASTTWGAKKAVKLSIIQKPSRGGESTLAVTLQTPLEHIRIVDTTVQVIRDRQNKRTTVETTVRWNRADIAEATVSYNEDPSSGLPFDLSVGVKSTSPIIPTVAIVLSAKSRPNHRLILLRLEYNTYKWKLEGDVKYRGRKTDVEFRVETPLTYFPKGALSSSFRAKGQQVQYDVIFNVSLPFEELQNVRFEGTLNPTADRGADSKLAWSKGTLSLISSAQSAALNAEFQLRKDGFTLTLTSDSAVTMWKIKTIQVQCDATSTRHDYSLSGLLTIENQEPHSFSCRMKGPPMDTHLSGSLTSPQLLQERNPVVVDLFIRLPSKDAPGIYIKFDGQESGTVCHHLQLELISDEPNSSSALFVTFSPLFNDEASPYNISAKLSNTDKGLRGSSLVVLPSCNFTCEAEYEIDKSKGSILYMLDATSTLKKLRKFRVYARQNGKEWDNMLAHLDVVVPIEGHHKFSSRVETRHRVNEMFDLAVYVDTPFDGYENISIAQRLFYNLDTYVASTVCDVVFDGVTFNAGARYNKSDGFFDVGADCWWRPADGAQKSILPHVRSSGETKFSVLCRGGAQNRNCGAVILSKGTPWEAEGFWNYSGWRHFDGEIFVDTPFVGSDRIGIGARNEMPLEKREMDTMLTVHWARKRVALVELKTNFTVNRQRGSINITTPFAIVRQVGGQAVVERNNRGIIGSAGMDINGQTTLDGAGEWLTTSDATWLNKTMAFELVNPWQPFSVSAATHRSAAQWTVNSSLVWNLEERQAHAVGVELGVFYRQYGREARFDFRHPKHEGGVHTFYEKIDSNFTHAFTMRWGRARSTLVAYNLWMRARNWTLDSSAGGALVVRRDAGFHWEHPGRHILCEADVVQRPRFTHAEVDFKWDSARSDLKRIRLYADLNDTSNQHRRQHKLQIGLNHPRLRRDVELNANTTFGFGHELFESKLCLNYSPKEEDRFVLSAALMDVSSAVPANPGLRTVGVKMNLLALHPASGLDMRLTSDWLKTRYRAFTNTSLVYLNRFDQEVVFNLEGSGDFVNENGSILMNSPGHVTQFYLALQHINPNNYTLIATKHIEHEPSYSSRFFYQPENPYIEANITLEKEKSEVVRFQGGFATPRHVDFQIQHDNNVEIIRDVSAVLKLNTSHLLTARAYWSPNISNYVQEAANGYISGVHRQAMTSLSTLWDETQSEASDKLRLGWATFAQALQPLVDEAQIEIEACLNDFVQVRVYLAEMYRNNDLLVKDIFELLEKSYDHFRNWYEMASLPFDWDMQAMYDYLEAALQALRDAWNATWEEWNELLSDWIDQIWRGLVKTLEIASGVADRMWERAGELLSRLPDLIRNMVASVGSSNSEMMAHLAKLSAIVEKIRQLWDKFTGMVRSIKTWIRDKFDWIVSCIITSEVYVFVVDHTVAAYHAIKYFLQYSVLDWFARQVEVTKQYMTEEQRQIMDSVVGFLFRLRDNIWSLIPRIINHPLLEVVSELTSSLWTKVQWTLRYFELIPDGWMTVLRAYSRVKEAFTTTIEESSDGFDSPNYVYCAPELGQIEMDQYLPFPWSNLKNRPKLSDIKEISALYELWHSLQSNEEDSYAENQAPPFMSWFYVLKQKLNYRTWLPPFPTQGLLAGRQHYVTFDGQVVEFAGTCSYLLSHDFTDGNFTVAVNYDGSRSGRPPIKRSLTVWMDNQEIEIHPNFQVSLNKRKVQLPQSFGHTSVLRDGNRVVVRNGYGVLVTCYPVHDVCTFRVSGWYFGRTAGLLGTYNSEPHDDVVTPDGRVSRGLVSVWGHSWALPDAVGRPSTQCRLSQNLVLEPTKKDPNAESLCQSFFNDTFSNFRRCFHKVDPEPFLNMCLSDIQSRNATDDVCTSAAAYVYMCIAHEVAIRMPRNCVKCVLPNNHVLHEGGNITMNSTTKFADVVFVIEAKKCNREIGGVFNNLILTIDGAMNRAGIQETRFATVVFGGSGARDKPHIHTADSKIFSSQTSALNASMANFRVGRGMHDVFDALRFVAKLPFRPGASKNVVLMSCSFGEVVEMRADYPEVHRMLLEDGITVHLLLDQEFNVKNQHKFYGIDGVNAFTDKDSGSKELKGDSDLRRQVAPPKDIYVPIALESNGTVFSSVRLYQHSTTKSFLDVYGRRVAQTAEQRTCQTCDCLPDDDGVGRVYCQPCVFPRPAHVYMNPGDVYDPYHKSIYQIYQYKKNSGNDSVDYEEETGSDDRMLPEEVPSTRTPDERSPGSGGRKNTINLTRKTRRKTNPGG